SLACQVTILGVVMIRRRAKARAALAGAAVLAVAVAMVSWLGARQILERFSSMQSVEVTEAKRVAMARGTWHIFMDYPVLGTGLGSIQTVYPAYETLYDAKVVNHTHNDYLEALAETGVVGGICCAYFLLILFLDSRQRLLTAPSPFAATLQLAAVIGCIGFLVHSLVDFKSHIPANAILFFLLALLATSEIPTAGMRPPSRHSRGTQEIPASASPTTIPNS